VQLGQPRPEYSWSVDDADGTITVICQEPFPDTTNFWYAHTIDGAVRRDFRLATCPDGCPNPKKYTLHNVTWFNDNQYVSSVVNGSEIIISAVMDAPATGWVGFVVELGWKDPNGGTFTVSSAPSILPLTYPYPDCVGEGCLAGLV
jgi:hypothetical protein